MSAKAQKPQEYFVYFKVFATQAGAKFAAKRARGFIQRFFKLLFSFGAHTSVMTGTKKRPAAVKKTATGPKKLSAHSESIHEGGKELRNGRPA
ncbi:MAG: hypothetical protein IJU29_04505 [Oscillospiraceae bacterium]|nr:hypothetical protein [Oscillospiraceae bacterium]